MLEEFMLGHAEAIVGNHDLVIAEFDPTGRRVGIVGVLHQLRQRDVPSADQSFAELLYERCVDDKVFRVF